ncbi:MAG: BtrH N-terminal domain-containing protein [Candidatus Lokiarchaeota archaeon]|jgi:hypothetical protein
MGDILIKNFIHRIGYHCESSSMRDLFEYYGFPMSEAMAFGLDGTMGFSFFDTTSQTSFIPNSDIPFFIGGKQGTIEPNSLACRLLGITLRKQSFSSENKAWEESKKLLEQSIPLILRVDIAFMPYEAFDESIGETHFGGHTVTLAGYNEEKEETYIGDTEFQDFQEVPIDILKKARSSIYGPKFLHPNNTQFSMIRHPDDKHPNIAAGIKLAIQQVVNNMLRPSMNYHGIQVLKRFANSILNWDVKLNKTTLNSNNEEISLARLMFELIYGYIEKWGTGGAIFRNLYKDFLEELIIHQELKERPKAWSNADFHNLEESIKLIADSIGNWTLFSETLKTSIKDHKDDCLNHIDLNFLHNIALKILTREDKLFRTLLKIKL